MASGVEVAGLVLAILPLLVKKLDDYAAGLATIRAFGSKTHRFEMKIYAARLGAQKAILMNGVVHLIRDAIGDDVDVAEVLEDPHHSLWRDPKVEASLRTTLANNYGIFVANLTLLLKMLKELSDKLGLQRDESGNEEGFVSAVRKYREVFSRPVYDNLLRNIEAINLALRMLSEDARATETIKSNRRADNHPLTGVRRTRKYARTLHRALTQQRSWRCPAEHGHVVSLRVDPVRTLQNMRLGCQTVFNVAVVSDQPLNSWSGQELEIKTIEIQSTTSNPASPRGSMDSASSSRTRSHPSRASSSGSTSSHLPRFATNAAGSSSAPPQIRDCCSVFLTNSSTASTYGECLGFIERSDHRHEIYFLRHLTNTAYSEALDGALDLAVTGRATWSADQHYLSRRGNRLRVAAALAISVLNLSGNWLKAEWRSNDISLSKRDISQQQDPEGHSPVQLEFSWRISCQRESGTALCVQQHRSSLLFPLGVALVELALCQSLASLYLHDEDADPSEDGAQLKTATRMLPHVASEFGKTYETVAKRCLSWQVPRANQARNEDDDEQIQSSIYESVVYPLIQILGHFEGWPEH
ncbi:hypothetical protein G647_00517 [Cladophialophora carrionii CBS 160.54]|uniref:DUF7580 domain-containing protein n=1 Tax=Cladophialophora carrionii CBS 160.54 TaxID=1279043 RepID=V9DP26_9EURO|nr:uncharacterized protein G647_00517 [Cladophialophora carrionii CBS 160.54]ETI28068.1 hypothetical protein G647_00517 [Cladophialophora carrionii CBS 160.54]